MSAEYSVKDQSWFQNKRFQEVFALLNADDGEARVAGGAVRNSLMGRDVADIDIATTLLPIDVVERAKTAGMKPVPTGIEHGTVTIVNKGATFEVTTLREDIDTDGRHAEVRFGKDWQKDADRRDLTINGLYADVDGNVIDLVGGLVDIETANVRFIGNAEQRIEEDYLRVLRFFRFFAQYGKGRPDAEGLKASARAVSKLSQLSAERIWKEMRLLFSADDPSRALLWMRTTGVLTAIFPETEKWGIDSIGPLMETREAMNWENDPMLLLEAIIPPDVDRVGELAGRLKMSGADRDRLKHWAQTPKFAHDMAETALDRKIYRGSWSGVKDVLSLSLVSARSRAEADDAAMIESAGFTKLLARTEKWVEPKFPLSGKDLMALGVSAGKEMGDQLKKLEELWIESNFNLSKSDLLAKL
ncbi:MAG: CCA tRNA nucleotidyltransferase [Rhizobiaceae bacterium]|nr:CCA tRNA nucleotidyltransferase [Rhizobiaceae bacterium]